MMNTPYTEEPIIKRSHWVAMVLLLCCALVSDVNIQIVIAQDTAPASASAPDDGESPSPQIVDAPSVPTQPEPQAPAVGATPREPQALAVGPTQAPTVGPASEPGPASEVTSQDDLNSIPVASESISDIARTANDAVRNLSVEPGSRPLLPVDRPSWVGAPADLSTKNHMLSVGSIPMLHEREVDSALDEPLVAAVHNYIDEHIANGLGAAASMPVDAEYIRRNLIDDPKGYTCELSTSEGPLHQKWVRVRITPEQRHQFQQWHIEATQRNRMGPLGVVLVSTFLLVGLSHMLLRTRHGVTSLPLVNQAIPNDQVAAKAKRSWALPTFFTIIALMALAMAFFVLMMVSARKVATEYPVVVHTESWPVVPEPLITTESVNIAPAAPAAPSESVRLPKHVRVEKLTVPVIKSVPHQ